MQSGYPGAWPFLKAPHSQLWPPGWRSRVTPPPSFQWRQAAACRAESTATASAKAPITSSFLMFLFSSKDVTPGRSRRGDRSNAQHYNMPHIPRARQRNCPDDEKESGPPALSKERTEHPDKEPFFTKVVFRARRTPMATTAR